MTRGVSRWLAGGAGLLALASFLITRLGIVPINGRIKQWAATSAPADHAEILARWRRSTTHARAPHSQPSRC
ncbi:anthrone oxygenase family protein [Streptomyces sp. NRRL S-118]|uniref:anthrone oxygenase family protein n=1 Tax=Streptomyces sp. NRRL S-118 TaxID=1463881 RepID=UPI002D21B7D6|nr:anthrone oxygenase family protein [Streptomyces sp. NRRL S-118]